MESFLSFLRRKLSRYDRVAHVQKAKSQKEVAKVIVSTSGLGICKKLLVHIVPILTTILVLTLNFKGLYIGEDFSGPIRADTINIVLLQVAAKAHEILIGGSLGTIVLHAVRNELVFGDGLPLGLIGSGLSFNTLDFFFQKQFRGAVFFWFKSKRTPRKAKFVLLLVISGVVATLSGPSSAVLLVPKSQNWPSGGTEYFLDGAIDDFWPSDMSGDLTELQSFCQPNVSTALAVCPAGGFVSLWEHWGRVTFSDFNHQDVRSYAKRLSGSTLYWPVHSPASQIVSRHVLGNARLGNAPNIYTYFVQTHAASATILQRLTSDWWSAIAPQQRVSPLKIDDRKAYSISLHATTSVRCSEPQVLSVSDRSVMFPPIRGRFDYDEPIALDINTLIVDPINHLRFQWVHLPDEYGAVSIGGVFQTSWTANQSRIVIGCSAQAGWLPAQATTDAYSFWTGWYPWNITYGGRLPAFHGGASSPTNGRIAFGDVWLNLLTPTTTTKRINSRIQTPSTIESILENAGLDDRDFTTGYVPTIDRWMNDEISNGTRNRLIEAVISSVIVDGISRYGSHRIFQNASDPNDIIFPIYQKLPDFDTRIIKGQNALATPTRPLSKLTTLRVDMLITGISFRQNLAGYLAMVVLLIHFFMAVSHMIWILYKGQTSKSWSMISELIAISYNSPTQSTCLANAGAGISNGLTFSKVAKMKSTPCGHGLSAPRVDLVFEDEGETCETTQALVDGHLSHSLVRRTTVKIVSSQVNTCDEENSFGDHDSIKSVTPLRDGSIHSHEQIKIDHIYG